MTPTEKELARRLERAIDRATRAFGRFHDDDDADGVVHYDELVDSMVALRRARRFK